MRLPHVLLCVSVLGGCLVPDGLAEPWRDGDGDGANHLATEGGTDCDDDDPAVGPHASEICGNGIDDDCDGGVDDVGEGAILWFLDADADGTPGQDRSEEACTAPRAPGQVWSPAPQRFDCDDADPAVHPGVTLDCTGGVDDDCDGLVDEDMSVRLYVPDHDGDGFGDASAAPAPVCGTPEGISTAATDCDDQRADVFPGADDAPYDAVDADCAGDLDADFDADGDGAFRDPLTLPAAVAWTLPPGAAVDCDDTDPSVLPGALDAPYDGLDAACDGGDDFDADGDGFPVHPDDLPPPWAYAPPPGTTFDCDDHNADAFPGAADAPYDGVDADCGRDLDAEFDLDGDGAYAAAAGGWAPPSGAPADCDDTDPDVWATCHTCVDADDDGAFTGCDAYLVRAPDCDDADPGRHPGAVDVMLNGADEDCSGTDLGTALDDGAVVQPTGTDHPTCGSPADPCRTPAGALSANPGAPLMIVGGGPYEALTTDVPVLGCFDPVTGQPDTSARVVFTNLSAGQPTGFAVRVWSQDTAQAACITAEVHPAPSFTEGLSLAGEAVVGAQLEAHAIGDHDAPFAGVATAGGVVWLDGVAVTAPPSSARQVGVEAPQSQVTIDHLTVDLGGSSDPSQITAGVLAPSSDLALRDAAIRVEGAGPLDGVAAEGVAGVGTVATLMRVRVDAVAPTGTAQPVFAVRLEDHGAATLVGVTAHAHAGTAVRLAPDTRLASTTNQVAATVAVATGARFDGCGLDFDPPGGGTAHRLELDRAWLEGPDGTFASALRAGQGTVEITGAVIDGDADALVEGTSFVLDHVRLAPTCLRATPPLCAVDDLPTLAACGWAGCTAASALSEGSTAAVRDALGVPMALQPGSAAEGANHTSPAWSEALLQQAGIAVGPAPWNLGPF